jgi:S1-C subfamily serine protease
VIRRLPRAAIINGMSMQLSNQMADAVAAVSASVVQVRGRRRPASGITYADGIVLTTLRVLGGEETPHIRTTDNTLLEAELAGWDLTTSLAVLRVPGLTTPSLTPSQTAPRVGHLAIAVGRSWSNALTASAGLVSVIGGPLPTGRRRAIDQVIRTSAPVHDGFSGGPFIDTAGGLIGVTTATAIRGFTVVIPAAIAWSAAARVLEQGPTGRGYLGIVGQPVTLPEAQAAIAGRSDALLVAGVAPSSPASEAGILAGDIVLGLDGRTVASPEDLLDLLGGVRVGQPAGLRLIRGREMLDIQVTVGERPRR